MMHESLGCGAQRGFLGVGCDKRAARTERQVALQPDDEIEGRHAPADGKTAVDVAAQDGIYRGRNLKHALWIEKNFDEFLRIPGIDEAQVTLHHAAQQPFVFREKARCFARMIEYDVENVGALFTREEGKENATAENRVDES